MPADAFEYDVFISFASSDQELVKPVWQGLTSNGLRVFWSDSSLRDSIGSSWFDVVQQSLTVSRHLLVVFTPAALASTWVKREYVAFFNHCYRSPARLLVPMMASGCSFDDLPLFLREVESCLLEDPASLTRLIRVFGGVNVEQLRRELADLGNQLVSMRNQHVALQNQLAESQRRLAEQSKRNEQELITIRDSLQSQLAELKRIQPEPPGLVAEDTNPDDQSVPVRMGPTFLENVESVSPTKNAAAKKAAAPVKKAAPKKTAAPKPIQKSVISRVVEQVRETAANSEAAPKKAVALKPAQKSVISRIVEQVRETAANSVESTSSLRGGGSSSSSEGSRGNKT